MVIKKHKLQSPIIAKEKVESFINSTSVDPEQVTGIVSNKTQPVNITLNTSDLTILEEQIDNANCQLNRRSGR